MSCCHDADCSENGNAEVPKIHKDFNDFMSQLHPKMQEVASNFNLGPETEFQTLKTLYEIVGDIEAFMDRNTPLTEHQRKTLQFQIIYCKLAKFSFRLTHKIEKIHDSNFHELKQSLKEYQETELHYFQKLIIFFEIFRKNHCFHLAKTFLDLIRDFLKTIDSTKENLLKDVGFTDRDTKDLLVRIDYIPHKLELDLMKEYFIFHAHLQGRQPIWVWCESLVDTDQESSNILKELIVHEPNLSEEARETYDVSKRLFKFDEAEKFADLIMEKYKLCEEKFPEFKRCSRRILKPLNKMGIIFDSDITDYLQSKESLRGLLYQKTALFCEDLDTRQKMLKKSIDTIKSSEDGQFVEADYKEAQDYINMAESDRSHELYWKARFLIARKNSEFDDPVTAKPLMKVAKKRINHGEKFIEMILEDDVKSQMERELYYCVFDLINCSKYLLRDDVLAHRFANHLSYYMKEHLRVSKEFLKETKLEIVVHEIPERELVQIILELIDETIITV